MANNLQVPLFIGEHEFISFDFTYRLQPGQTVVSAVYTCEAPVTEDAATAAVNSAGTIAQARFYVPPTAVNGTRYTVQCTVTCANPVATKILYALILAIEVPT